MTIEDACQQLAKQTFDLDCREIRFERQGKAPLSFGGPGNISRDETGSLNFKAYLSESDFSTARQAVIGVALPPGELIPEEFLFKISATAYDEITWTGKAWPSGMSNILAGAGIVTGDLQELRSDALGTQRNDITEERVWVYLPYVLDFPKVTATHSQSVTGTGARHESIAWDHAALKISEEKFTVIPRQGYTEIECVFESGGIADDHHGKILEALQFALGQVLQPCALLFVEKGIWSASLLSSDPTVSESWRQHPPPHHVYDIAKAYYQTITGQSNESRHSLAREYSRLLDRRERRLKPLF